MALFQVGWIAFSFLCGALPFAVWIGFWAGVDIRESNDRNPGATNTLRAAGWRYGLIAYLAEFSKAAVPVGIAARVFGWDTWVLLPIAIAPSLGHAFNPFLNWKGGKAIATMLGAWIGLSLAEMPIVLLTSLLIIYLFVSVDGWTIFFTALSGIFYVVFGRGEVDLIWLTVLMLQLVLLWWTHRQDLKQPPGFKWPWRAAIEEKGAS